MKSNLAGVCAVAFVAAFVPRPLEAQTGVPGVPANRPDQNPTAAPTRPASPVVQEIVVRDETAAIKPFTLSAVTLDGATLPEAKLAAAYRPFIGKTIDNAALSKIVAAVAAVYDKSDVALYTVVVPDQKFAGGRLRLAVVEGYVGAVEVRGKLRQNRANLLRAYLRRLERERPLRKSSLQRVVSLIRDMPGFTPDLSFERGQKQGAVKLVIKAGEKVVQVAAGISDRGTALLGRTQVQTDAYVNGMLGGADQLHASLVLPTHVDRFQYYALAYSAPLDADGTTASATVSHLRTRPSLIPLKGDSTSLAFQVSHPIIRSYTKSLYATIGIDGIDTDNAFLGFTLSNDRVRALRTALSYTASSKRNQITLSSTGSFGLDILGARVIPGQSDQRFRKLNVKLLDTLQVGKRFALRLDGVVQLTPDKLPSSEQLALGGDEFGRAYEAAIIAGDYGYAGSAEFAWLPQNLPKPIKGSELYVYMDDGKTFFRRRPGIDGFKSHVASAGGGIRLEVLEKTVVQVEATRGFYNPVTFEDREKLRALFSIRTLF